MRPAITRAWAQTTSFFLSNSRVFNVVLIPEIWKFRADLRNKMAFPVAVSRQVAPFFIASTNFVRLFRRLHRISVKAHGQIMLRPSK